MRLVLQSVLSFPKTKKRIRIDALGSVKQSKVCATSSHICCTPLSDRRSNPEANKSLKFLGFVKVERVAILLYLAPFSLFCAERWDIEVFLECLEEMNI